MPARRQGRRLAACACTLLLAALPAHAQVWRFGSSIGIEETLTNNVNLAPNDQRQSDLVSQVTPGFTVSEKGAHTSLDVTVSMPLLFHARTSSENNTIEPQVSALGLAELVPRFFFVEGAVSVSQQFLSPFGAQPASLANSTANRYTNATYRVSPYIRGAVGTDITYSLRDDVLWTKNYGTSGINTNNATDNSLTGTIARAARPFGWQADVERTDTRFEDARNTLVSELARVQGIYQVDPQLQLALRGGYEHDDYGLGGVFNSSIYGAGATWHPTDRTTVDGYWEHRFFGSAYRFDFSHRMREVVWSLQASRDKTSYPQQLAALPAGLDMSSVLNQLFLTRYPDPAERQTIVDQFISSRGLPSMLGAPVIIYTQQITLNESLVGSVGLLGARNSVFVSVFRTHDQPIVGPDIAFVPGLIFGNNTTQFGSTVAWSHTLAPLVTLTASATASRTEGTANTSEQPVTRQGIVQALVSRTVTPKTHVFVGARYQAERSNIGTEYNEAAVFAGLTHQFQ